MLETQRLACAVVASVGSGKNLTAALAALTPAHPGLTPQQRAAIADISYGTLRFGLQLESVLDQLLTKPLRDQKLRWLLLIGLYQLQYTRAAPYAVVDHAVRCAAMIGEPQAAGLVNAVLRNFLRKREKLLTNAAHGEQGRFAFPQWWIDKLRDQYPACYADALTAANLHPPFTLRVNHRRMQRDTYLQMLCEQEIAARATGIYAVTLERPMAVDRLPGFAQGLVSVQDSAAQSAAPLLDAQTGMHVLDACAAPGGKTTHLLELADVDVTALDVDASRLALVRQNLERLQLHARVVTGDAVQAAAWWDGRLFERVLLDAPCSASGVVRRHPDIKWLRRPGDVSQFVAQQAQMLDSVWRLLASGGKLLYTTCSIFQEENSSQVAEFLTRHTDAQSLPLCGLKTLDGIPQGQLLPDSEHDGFFYALLQKA